MVDEVEQWEVMVGMDMTVSGGGSDAGGEGLR